ncbi:fumarylacetoacetate (FAA) hydrolase [Rubrobacter xylanophilus DSM 9941]|uniref:Fumarylacetoacetate (FAA) hydrolase n=1 Tax=Rubrobacter xylanophilus (strain DSM 9941 / JCM 11954 / NBRC 16129 / PRD-1) TaxID=266117 RepID=Q1ATV3_RUBXD|nr:fumarylacetoacetate hydrolase family protein [Rubrobacter xylanophilus]ABG05175.1 fumarylacetoacetate (FAA) hydrolase [Rubrobacter xylanophilus DSM 9941]
MRIVRYETGGIERLGVVSGEEIGPLPEGTDVLDLLAADPEERDRIARTAEASVPLTGVRLLAPLQPPTLRDFVVFEEHVEGITRSVSEEGGVPEAWYEIPTFYFGNPYSVIGPQDPVAVPPGCEALDFELEVAAIIGRAGSNLAPEEARGHIAGYTILNDWSARDLQRHEMQIGLGPAKGKDFANTLGPWIVTSDELEPYRRDGRLHLEMEVFVNGEKLGDDTLANMAWSFEELVAYASRGTWVRPGDVLGSGTCGSGCLAELWGRVGRQEPPLLEPGDVVRMTVEGIGTIENRVVEGVSPVPIPRARPAAFRRMRSWGA